MSDTKIYDWLQGMFNYYAKKFTGDKRNDDFSLKVLLAITNHKLEGRINIADYRIIFEDKDARTMLQNKSKICRPSLN